MEMLATSYCTAHRVPNARVRERIEGAERVCNPIGRTAISINQNISEIPWSKPPIKEHTL